MEMILMIPGIPVIVLVIMYIKDYREMALMKVEMKNIEEERVRLEIETKRKIDFSISVVDQLIYRNKNEGKGDEVKILEKVRGRILDIEHNIKENKDSVV